MLKSKELSKQPANVGEPMIWIMHHQQTPLEALPHVGQTKHSWLLQNKPQCFFFFNSNDNIWKHLNLWRLLQDNCSYYQVKIPIGFGVGGIWTRVHYLTIRDFTS